MKKKTIIVAIILVIVFVSVLVYFRRQETVEQSITKEILNVTTQKAYLSDKITQNLEYPAIIAGDQQVTLTAGASGTITRLNFNLGSKVSQGSQLVVIDEIGNNSKVGEKGLKSSNIQALELSVESAEERYKSAKRAYDDNKTYTNKKAREIAEIDLQAAKVNLRGALDNHFAVSPITGTITEKFVSQGDSVSVGQKIATISKTALTKVQFFVDKEELSNFKIGTKIAINEDGKIIEGTVARIAPEADPTTKRFLIEAKPSGKNSLLIGSVIIVSLDITRVPSVSGNLILPLSIVTISQNESYIFIVENGRAKKINVSVEKVQGEYAEVKINVAADAEIIMDGSKIVKDGEEIKIAN